MSSLKPWILGARPKTLPAAIAPVIVATAYAGDSARFESGFAALMVAIALQVAVNYANDYSDGVRGTDKDRRGPLRLVGSGTKSAKSVKRAAFLAFFVAVIFGSYLAFTSSLWLFVIGLVAMIAAWRYTGGDRPYGYRGLGEISVFVFFGLVATIGSYFVQTQEIDLKIALMGTSMGAIACGILLLNNIRDIDTDKVAGKRTLSVRIGKASSLKLYWSLIATAIIIFIALTPLPWTFLIIATIPFLTKLRTSLHANEWIKALEATGKFQMLYAALLSLALILALR
jgi:1,4-dihydroxy-2-naphthoate octaprenyltransferase